MDLEPGYLSRKLNLLIGTHFASFSAAAFQMGTHIVAGELNFTDGVKIEPPSTLWVLQEEFLSWHKVAGTKGSLLACGKYLSSRASPSFSRKKKTSHSISEIQQ